MRRAIMIGEEPCEKSKGIEFTYVQERKGWATPYYLPSDMKKIVYLGKCSIDGDMFCTYIKDRVLIYKGNLNDGTY